MFDMCFELISVKNCLPIKKIAVPWPEVHDLKKRLFNNQLLKGMKNKKIAPPTELEEELQ
jgi:hypothetical protein